MRRTTKQAKSKAKPRVNRTKRYGSVGTSTTTHTKKRVRATFSAQATSPTVTPLRGMPTVYYSPKAWVKIQLAIQECANEVGWLGTVATLPNGYLIEDIYVPKQTVSATETDIDEDAMADLAMQLMDQGIDPSTLIYWGHSHVNMGVTPSGQDEDQLAEFLQHCPLFIRGIYNKKGAAKVDIFDANTGLIYQSVPRTVHYEIDAEEKQQFLDGLKTNVNTRTWARPLPRAGVGLGSLGLGTLDYNDDDDDENDLYGYLDTL